MFEEEETLEESVKEAIKNNDYEYITKNVLPCINKQYETNYTALMHAVEQNNLQMVRFLIDHGASIKPVITPKKGGAIKLAEKVGNQEILRILKEGKLKSRIDDTSERDCDNPQSRKLVMEDYIASNTDSTLEIKGEYPLIYAAREGNLDAIISLISNGADVNVLNSDAEKAWQIAADKKNWQIVEELFNANFEYMKLHKYDPDYLPELKLFVHLISNEIKAETLVERFWNLITANEENVIEIGNRKLLLIMQLLPCAIKQDDHGIKFLDPRIPNLEKLEKIVEKYIDFQFTQWDGDFSLIDRFLPEPRT